MTRKALFLLITTLASIAGLIVFWNRFKGWWGWLVRVILSVLTVLTASVAIFAEAGRQLSVNHSSTAGSMLGWKGRTGL